MNPYSTPIVWNLSSLNTQDSNYKSFSYTKRWGGMFVMRVVCVPKCCKSYEKENNSFVFYLSLRSVMKEQKKVIKLNWIWVVYMIFLSISIYSSCNTSSENLYWVSFQSWKNLEIWIRKSEIWIREVHNNLRTHSSILPRRFSCSGIRLKGIIVLSGCGGCF